MRPPHSCPTHPCGGPPGCRQAAPSTAFLPDLKNDKSDSSLMSTLARHSLSGLFEIIFLIITTTLKGMYQYYPHFIDKETETQRS